MELGKAVQLVHNLTSGIVKHVIKLREDKSYRNKTNRCVIQSDRRLIHELTSYFNEETQQYEQHTIPKKLLFYSSGDQDHIHSIIRAFPKMHKYICLTNEALLHKTMGLQNEDPEKYFMYELAIPPERPILLKNEIEEKLRVGKEEFGEEFRTNFRTTEPPSFVVINNIQDPGNVGNILRCCIGFAFRHIYFVKGSTDCWNDKVLRASRGALLTRNSQRQANLTYEYGDLERLVAIANDYKMPMYVSDSKEKTNQLDQYVNERESKKIIVFNNEAMGVSDSDVNIFQQCDSRFVCIPTSKHCTSLNVASAAAIMLYSLRDKDALECQKPV